MQELSDPQNSSDQIKPRGPRFSLFHLLTLVTACGIAMGIQERVPISLPAPNPSDPFWRGAFWALQVLTASLAIAGLIILVREQISTRKLFQHPGYLLLLAGALFYIFVVVANYRFGFTAEDTLASIDAKFETMRLKLILWTSSQVSISILYTLVVIIGCIKYRWWWRACFAVLIVATLASISGMVFNAHVAINQVDVSVTTYRGIGMVQGSIALASGLLIFVCLIIDLITKTRRDWIHWLGIIVHFLISFGMGLLTMIASRFVTANELYNLM